MKPSQPEAPVPAAPASAAPPAPDTRLAAAFGRHVARWSREQGAASAAADLAQRAATLVSLATADGHSCMAVGELTGIPRGTAAADEGARAPPLEAAALRALLLESKVVGSAEAPGSLPLILDGERLYLHRYFDYERRLARTLAARSATLPGASDPAGLPPGVAALLDRLFAPAPRAPAGAADPPDPDWQKIAVITALLGRLTIISGGPGTGKTTTVVNLLACLLAAEPNCRIALTAPTGKAAARLTEVIQQRAISLPGELRARLPDESSTIHRLLGGVPNGTFRFDAANQLPIDVLIVDEASMLDLALAVHLIEAVPPGARIILLGDKDQLAAVESGAVFSELTASPSFSASRIATLSRLAGIDPAALASAPAVTASTPEAPASTLAAPRLQDSVIWLRRNYRFAAGSAIALLATAINEGRADRVLALLRGSADPSLVWIDDGRAPTESLRAALEGFATYREAVRSTAADDREVGADAGAVAHPRAIAAAFARFRTLCAVRDGPWGVDALNRQIGAHFRRTVQHPLDPGLRSEWYPGRPVMVLRNDAVLKLFNGDIGIVLTDAAGALQVYFPDDAGGFRSVAPVRLPEHETAFAMTVHKSQGSEFDDVLLMLPAGMNRVLARELLYTAVTRARVRLTIVANAAVILGTVNTPTRRMSGLLSRAP